ncbi:c-type cytochrome [Litoribrevibacter euphylliae]|uniref:C-type cytochrome n=1 Tax=Litoribrevibacter euphylliae TaxID=1834034 RepID=A0ABV7HKM8_9GAMM
MFKLKLGLSFLNLLLMFSSQTYAFDEIQTNSGKTLEQKEIDSWSITVYPNGRNLPEGSGNALQGERIYQDKCLMCHGPNGEQGVAPRLAGELGYPEWSNHPLLALTVGAWPHATSIFDYIRRAMPHQSPKTLSNSDVYALTAYILSLNDLIEKSTEMNRETLSNIVMPYKTKSYNAWEVEEQGRLNVIEPPQE